MLFEDNIFLKIASHLCVLFCSKQISTFAVIINHNLSVILLFYRHSLASSNNNKLFIVGIKHLMKTGLF